MKINASQKDTNIADRHGFVRRRRTLAPAAYSHDLVAKQWPRYCEPPGSKPCRYMLY